MKTYTMPCIGLSFVMAIGSMVAAAASSPVESVVIKKDSNMYLTDASGQVFKLTHDGAPKDMPLFSKDGLLIAYDAPADRGGGNGMIVIIDRQGQERYRVYVHPHQAVGQQAADYDAGSAPYFEHFEWLTNSSIAVSGAINPSSSEDLIYDLPATGAPYQFFDDGEVAYSPDGRQVAYVTGMPHWEIGKTPILKVIEQLGVDNHEVTAYPASPKSHIRFISPAQWSSDSQTVAILVQDSQTHAVKLVLWTRNRRPALAEAVLPIAATAALATDSNDNNRATVFHDENGWVVVSARGAWQLGIDGKTFLSLQGPAASANPAIAASALRGQLGQAVRAEGEENGYGADFWCASCSLSKLPRRTGD